jgi:hypothetical protein
MRKLVVLLLASLFVIGLAACGGGGDDKVSTASDSDSTATTKASSGDGGGGAYCGLAAKYSGLQNFNPSGDAASIRATLENAKAALDESVRVAPSEIKADVRVIADAFGPFIEALAKANYDFTKLNPQDPAFAKIQDPQVTAASQRITAWAKAHCSTNTTG